MTDQAKPVRPAAPRAGLHLADRPLLWLVGGALAALGAWFALRGLLPVAWRTPGSPPLYLAGVAGAVLLLVPVAFLLAKRTGRGGAPPAWMFAHVLATVPGAVLVGIHSAGRLEQPPALLLLALVGLVATGAWARVRTSRAMAATFATRWGNFRPPDAATRAALADLIAAKTALLARLEPGAAEGTFSVTLGHWLRHPLRAAAYARLSARERRLMGSRRAAGLVQGRWRQVHLALAFLFVAGIVAHVVTVTFFAGYVAAGRPITWWHLAEW